MRKEFEKLKEQFGVVNPKISSTKKALKISHLELDLKEFTNKISFSFDCGMFEDSSQTLGPHGHRGSTYSLEWSPKEYPGLLCLKNKLAGKLKSLKECPEYLQDYVLKNINFFVEALQKELKGEIEDKLNSLYDQEELMARQKNDEL